jgi:hypothetical protein
MSYFLIYAADTGTALRRAKCPAERAAMFATDGEGFALLSAEQEEIWKKLRWNGSALVAVEPPTLDALKAARWSAASDYRNAFINGGCTTSFGRVDSNETSRNYMLGARELAKDAKEAGSTLATGWKMADDSIVPLTPDQVIQMTREVGLFVAACQANAQAIGVAIEAAPDAEALAVIDITAGYP